MSGPVNIGDVPVVEPTDALVYGATAAVAYPFVVVYPVGKPALLYIDEEHDVSFHATEDQAVSAVALWHRQQARTLLDAQAGAQ